MGPLAAAGMYGLSEPNWWKLCILHGKEVVCFPDDRVRGDLLRVIFDSSIAKNAKSIQCFVFDTIGDAGASPRARGQKFRKSLNGVHGMF